MAVMARNDMVLLVHWLFWMVLYAEKTLISELLAACSLFLPLWEPYNGWCEMGWKKITWGISVERASCLVLGWTASLLSGPVDLPELVDSCGMCVSEHRHHEEIQQWSKICRAGWMSRSWLAPLSPRGRTGPLYNFSQLNCFDYRAKSWPNQGVKLSKK